MATERQLRSAVRDAIVCMPNELSNVIGGYAARRPHRWTADGFIDGSTADVVNRIDGTTLSVDDRFGILSGWYTFVSDVSFADGVCEWSVELTTTINNNNNVKSGWIGVGITASTANRFADDDTRYAGIAGATDRLVCNIDRQLVLIDGQVDGVRYIGRITTADDINKIWFQADPTTGVVRARWYADNQPKQRNAYWFIPVSRLLPIGLMRPVVVVGGVASVHIRSEPVDMPLADGCQQRTIFRGIV